MGQTVGHKELEFKNRNITFIKNVNITKSAELNIIIKYNYYIFYLLKMFIVGLINGPNSWPNSFKTIM